MATNKTLVLYVHGKGGTATEAEHYIPLFPDFDVVGLDYKSETPWDAKTEFPTIFEKLSENYCKIILIANSIGAYFSTCALSNEKIEKAYFISPITDMEALICNMIKQSGISETELREKEFIETEFGETLSWEYLYYVRSHHIDWGIPTEILYGEHDALTDIKTVTAFADKYNAGLTIMKNGEHWFHTQEQMKFLDDWLKTK